jgi:citrate synthase
MQKEVGEHPTHDQIKDYLWKTLKGGQVVPGYIFGSSTELSLAQVYSSSYGHGVLRSPDPRFIAIQQFALSRPDLKDSPIIQLIQKVGLQVTHSDTLSHHACRHLRSPLVYLPNTERFKCPSSDSMVWQSYFPISQTKNPHPNVDATSGCVLYHYGVTEFKARRAPIQTDTLLTNLFLLVLYRYFWCITR